MSEKTKIEWCDHTWSPWRGYTKVSPGCAYCYAETLSKRNPAVLGQWGKGKPRVLAKNWTNPLRWDCTKICTNCGLANKLNAMVCSAISCAHFEFHRPRVFPSLCDWLDEEVPIKWLVRFLQLIHDTPSIDWLLLTKRPELFRDRMNKVACTVSMERGQSAVRWLTGNPPANVWVGASVEDQFRADDRIPALLKIPAKLRFLSVEPLISPVSFDHYGDSKLNGFCISCVPFNCELHGSSELLRNAPCNAKIGWVIVGGESGPHSRPCNVESIRSIVKQCAIAGVPVFVKQLGANPFGFWTEGAPCQFPQNGWKLRIKDPKGGDPEEWPHDLRVRQFPEVKQ